MAAMHLPQRCAVLTSAVHWQVLTGRDSCPLSAGHELSQPITPHERLHTSLDLWLRALPSTEEEPSRWVVTMSLELSLHTHGIVW